MKESHLLPSNPWPPSLGRGLSSSLGFDGRADEHGWRGLSLYALLTRSAGLEIHNLPLAWGMMGRNTAFFDQTGVPEAERKPVGYYDQWFEVAKISPSTLFTEDGTFTKLREMSVHWRISRSLLERIPGLGSLSTLGLTLTGRNLFTWTDYRGWDPEVGLEGGDTGSAAISRVDGYAYPNFRNWTVSVEVVF